MAAGGACEAPGAARAMGGYLGRGPEKVPNFSPRRGALSAILFNELAGCPLESMVCYFPSTRVRKIIKGRTRV